MTLKTIRVGGNLIELPVNEPHFFAGEIVADDLFLRCHPFSISEVIKPPEYGEPTYPVDDSELLTLKQDYRSKLESQFCGAIKSAINDHGHQVLGGQFAASAAKRIVGVLKAFIREQKAGEKSK